MTTQPGTLFALKARATGAERMYALPTTGMLDALAAHPAQEHVLAMGVVADLGDRVVGTGAALERELEELGHEVALEALEGIDGAAQEEAVLLGIREPVGGRLGGGDGAQLVEQGEERHGVDVEDGLGQALVARDRVVAGDGEDAGQAAREEVPAQALHRVAVAVAAGDVDDDVVTERPERLAGGVGARGGRGRRRCR